MRLTFQEIRPGDVEQELTQKDQFDTDKVPLTATLMREALQNVMDARAPGQAGPLRVVISIHESGDPAFWAGVFDGLAERMDASGVALPAADLSRPSFLTIEDFGTTGLRGRTNARDHREFSDFWRRVGRSHKSGTKGGSWGLGKLVFPVSSQIRCFFGLTVRSDDPDRNPQLMGQAILSTHSLGGRQYVPHGFFSDTGAGGIQIPATDSGFVARFMEKAGLARTDQPGLSVIIPFPKPEITAAALIPVIIEHYFFPILTGELVLEVAGEVISAETLTRLAARYPAPGLGDGNVTGFIRELDAARKSGQPVNVPQGWDGAGGFEAALGEDLIFQLRNRHLHGELLHFRLPLRFSMVSGERPEGSYDVFLKPAPAGTTATALFIRNAITVPNESGHFTNPHVFAALVASEPPVSAFLRDAENPAHTSWNGRAEKLVSRWKSPGLMLQKIRHSVRKLDQLVGNAENLEDPDALIGILSIPKETTRPAPPRVPNPISGRPPEPPPAKPRPFRIVPRKGGFTVAGPERAADIQLPMTISVRTAYAITRGDPFKRYQRHDFTLFSGIKMNSSGAYAFVTGENAFRIEVNDPKFTVEVSGFDPNRDLVVQANRQLA